MTTKAKDIDLQSWIENTFELMEINTSEQRREFNELRDMAHKKQNKELYTTLLSQNTITELQE